MEAGFSLGSNQGSAADQLREARRRLLALPDVCLLAQSMIYETEPVDVAPAYTHVYFLNAVLIMDSARSAQEWLSAVNRVEADMGRIRTADRHAPRPIDIDILYVGDACIESGGLTVPHPRWAQRRFVVQPLAEVRPDACLPGIGQRVQEVLSRLPEAGVTPRPDLVW